MRIPKSRLVIIDGNAIIHRAYHAMPAMTSPSGLPTNAVYGFVSMFLKIISELNPTYLAVAFDRPEPTFRHKEFADYQSQRGEADELLVPQFSMVRDVVESFNVSCFDKEGYEADDLIGTLSTKSKTEVDEVIIVTGDKDQFQLIDKMTKVFIPIKGLSITELVDEEKVVEKLGVRADQVVDYKALVGDPSDNYPGVYGIGPKSAAHLLEKFDSYPNVYEHLDEIPESLQKKLKDGKKGGDISYRLAKIVTDLPIEFDKEKLSEWDIGSKKTMQLFDIYGFRSIKKRVEGISKQIEEERQQKLF